MRLSALLLFCVFYTNGLAQIDDPGTQYLAKWKSFYPSKALRNGMNDAVFSYENRSIDQVTSWIQFNQNILERVTDRKARYVNSNPVDARLLKMQALKELGQWSKSEIHKSSPQQYADLIRKGLDNVLKNEFLSPREKADLICSRLVAVDALAIAGSSNIVSGGKAETTRAIANLKQAEDYYRDEVPESVSEARINLDCDYQKQAQKTLESISQFIAHLEKKILPKAKESSAILGKQAYAEKLRLYTDTKLTPDELIEAAWNEIEIVKEEIRKISAVYYRKKLPDKRVPVDVVEIAFEAMEKDAPLNSDDYLQFWKELSSSAQEFISDKEIATLPDIQTLRIMTAPESAGAAARIGWVSSAPAFAPNPVTTLYLPSIPNTLPAQEQIDFWSSFNKPFNRMIVIHELFPGHYMQIKVSRDNPHPVRLLFPYALYFEGWASFCEKIVLDAGWEADDPLTLLAHLRKRLENANRAYTSVQVHCNGWGQEKVMEFSTETSLLAPQFAKSLWGRLMLSPMQMTSYFLGGMQFKTLYKEQKEKLEDEFVLLNFMDQIMRTGPIPIDEFNTIFGPQ